MPETNEATNSIVSYILDFIIKDWYASIPITICFIAMLAVIIDRFIYYSRNHRELAPFLRSIQAELEAGNIDSAISISRQVGGLLGLMTEEGLRLIKFHSRNFINAFDISASLYIRDLEKRLSALATIGATAPFLGLFGTVIGVVFTLKLMGEGGSQSQGVVLGVAKALIATGYGLIVAIVAVMMNNYFNSVVKRYENDFQVIKLTLIDFIQSQQSVPSGNKQYTETSLSGQGSNSNYF